jgi:hypothetical protein
LKNASQFMKNYYERVIAIVVMLVLVALSVILLLSVLNIGKDIQGEIDAQKKVEPFKGAEADSMERITQMLEKPPMWTTNAQHRLFIAPFMRRNPVTKELYLYNDDVRQTTKVDGITLAWLDKNRLEKLRGVGVGDPDGDGFSNFEEYSNQTNPQDPNSKPDIIVKLRLVKLVKQPFPFIFKGMTDAAAGKKFEIHALKGGAEWVPMDEIIPSGLDSRFPGYKVIKFEEKIEKYIDPKIIRDGKPAEMTRDISELTVQRAGEKPVVLIKGKPTTFDEWFARLTFLVDNSTVDKRVRDRIPLQGSEYEVISINKKVDSGEEEVLVKKVNSKEPPKKILPYNSTESTPTTTPNKEY